MMNRPISGRAPWRLLIAAVIAGLAGCATPPVDRSPPKVELPAAWQHDGVGRGNGTAATANADLAAWWRSFNDPALDRLIAAALASNNDLAAAAIRVRRAQLQSGLARTNLFPDVTAGASYSESKNLETGRSLPKSFGTSVSVSYELDLWGRLSALRDASAWEALATEADRQATALTLVGTTATLYWTLGFLNERIAFSEASVGTARRTLELARVRREAGAATELDVAQAEQSLAGQEAAHTKLLLQRTESRNALALLFNRPPEDTAPEPAQLPTQPLPVVDAGLPAQVLARRPDLQAAEQRLRAAVANVDATRANFYPRLSLTGSLGTSSTELRDLLRNPIGALGLGLALPFVQWNTTRLNLQVSQTQYEEAVVKFRQALYTSLSEVENALAKRSQLTAEAEKLSVSLSHAQRADALSEVRFRAGATPLQPWLDAQEKARAAQVQLLQNRLDQLSNLVTLFKALGGGVVQAPPSAVSGAADWRRLS